MQRIVVIGTPGSGKTTLAQQLAAHFGYPFIELDALFWAPNWTPVEPAQFRREAEAALSVPQWSVGGNHRIIQDLIWQRADTLIWLDYALPLAMSRLIRRSLRRIISGEELWSGNRETWRNVFLQRDSILLFALQTHRRRRRQFTAELQQPAYKHLQVHRFRTPQATEAWRSALPYQVSK